MYAGNKLKSMIIFVHSTCTMYNAANVGGQWCSSFVLSKLSIARFKRCSQFVTECLFLCLALWCIIGPSSFCYKTFRLCYFQSYLQLRDENRAKDHVFLSMVMPLCLDKIISQGPGHRSTQSPMTGLMGGSMANNVPPGQCCCPRCLIWFYFFRAPLTFYGCIKDMGQQAREQQKMVKHFVHCMKISKSKLFLQTLPEAQRTQGIASQTWVVSPAK